jgi:hypothetical protein
VVFSPKYLAEPLSRPLPTKDGGVLFEAMCRDASRRQFDVVMAWSVDRLGRSLQDLVAFLGETARGRH